MIIPWKIEPVKHLGAILSTILAIVMAVIGIYCIINGDLRNGAIILLMGGFFSIWLMGRQLKIWEREIGVLGTVILLILVIIVAFTVQNIYFMALLLLIALVWGYFVFLGIYNVFIKRR